MSTKKSAKNQKNPPSQAMEWFRDDDIQSSLHTCKEIFNSQFLSFRYGRIASRAMFTLLIIHLNDLLGKANAEGTRISFSDGIDPTFNIDVTDLVNKLRNAVCHISSKEHLSNGGKFVYNISNPNPPIVKEDGGFEVDPRHSLDFIINFGKYHIHLEKHIIRAFNMVEEYFAEKRGLRAR